MKITILTTSVEHPVNAWLEKWILKSKEKHTINLIRSNKEIVSGDLLFLISCSELVSAQDRQRFNKTLVIHASDLPRGRGWSPHIWDIVNGKELITLSLLEAEDRVDSGAIWKKQQVKVPKTALYSEINSIIFEAELELMDFAVENFSTISPITQGEAESTYWPKRTPSDSEIDIEKSISEQFDLVRVCDPKRFPAFFYKDGKKFKLKIEAISE